MAASGTTRHDGPVTTAKDLLAPGLLDPAEAMRRTAAGNQDAAVLIPVLEDERGPVLVFTERRADLRRHPGEISFPGGRRDDDEALLTTALREAEEEVGLDRDRVEVIGALAPMGTFVTRYRIYPFVGIVADGADWVPSPHEVAQVLEFPLDELVAAYRNERLWEKRVPVRTPTFRVGGHLVWGATARLTEQLLRRSGLV